MNTVTIVLLVILAILIIAVVALYFLGKKAQKRQAEQQQQIDAMKQTVSMLIIDKKRMKLKDSGLPQAVIEQAPKLMRSSKLPIVKAKVGPQVMSLVCEDMTCGPTFAFTMGSKGRTAGHVFSMRREDLRFCSGQERSQSRNQRYLHH